MQYRKFGNTGIEISVLGFGAMRLPEYRQDGKWQIREEESIEIMHRAFDSGVNYVDTAYGYCHGNSEIVVGKALKGYRDKVYLSTKSPLWNIRQRGDYRRILEEQLKKLDVDAIDFYHFHSVTKAQWENTILKLDLVSEARKARDEGLIRHISFSFHDKPEVMKMLVDTGIFETVLCQYNLLDRSNEEAIAYAHAKGLGTVVMGPIGGGRLAAPSEIIASLTGSKTSSTPETALRFVLGNQNVHCALSGMKTMAMVEENVRTASVKEPLRPDERARINAMLEETKRLADLYCTGCDYCDPCPKGIKISRVFQIMNYHRVYGLTQYAREEYGKIGKWTEYGANLSNCSECGVCESKCPQKIKIREQLKQVASQLGGSDK